MEKTEVRIQRVFTRMQDYLNGLIQLGGGAYPGQVMTVNDSEPETHFLYALGRQHWESVSLQLIPPAEVTVGASNWTTVREFQRDIMTWIRLWPDYEFSPPGVRRPIHMSDMIQSFIEHLYQCDDQLLVSMKDASKQTLAVWIKAKNSTNDLKVKMVFPIMSSFNQPQPQSTQRGLDRRLAAF